MKTILASLLLLTSTSSAVIVPADADPITPKEIEQRIVVCADYFDGKLTAGQIISTYGLDSDRKKRDFELQCQMTKRAVQLGYNIAKEDFRKTI